MAALTAGGEYSERTFMLGNGGLTPHTMLLGKDGSMLVGAETGLYRFVPDSLLAYTSAYQRLLPYPVYSLFADSKGRLWIGTHGHGVLTTDARGRYIRLSAKDGLPSDVVQSVGEDRHGRICITTQDGAVYYSPSTRKMEYLYFHNDPKLNFFSENCALRLADGRMLFGTLGGLVVVNRDFRPSTRVPQQVDVTEVSVDGVPSWTLPQTGRAGADGGGRTLVVGHDESSVVFRFSNFNYLRLQPTHYSYMLEGCDKNWSAATELNFASYNDLPPGKYVFRVRCLGDDGTWTEPRAAFALTVLPPWWASPAAFAVYCVVLFLAAMVAYRYLHTVYRLRRDIAVEKRLTQFKLDFFTNISHEFRTPLTLIAGSMERIRQVGGSIGDLRMPIDRMQRSVDRMLRLVNQLLEFRRMQEDRLHLSLELTEVVGFLRGIADSFHDVAEGKGVALRFAPQCKRWEVFVDRGFLDKIVYELLNNAIKYTPAGGSVDLRLRNDGGSMVVMVANAGGQGAPPAGQPAAAVVTDERDHRLKEQIVAYAEAHIADAEFSADRFADGMGMGRSAFFAKFKSLTGKSPNEYLRELRLSRAAELLSAGPVTAAEVAYQVGMKTPQYFSTCFKKRFGVTPAQWQTGMRAAADSHAAG